jgi:sulfide:quinone oxidoreductase
VEKKKIVVVGGGTAGITAAAKLLSNFSPEDIMIVEPADVHYYQPLWTLVGAGVVDAETSVRPMASVIPDGVTWKKNKVSKFHPEENKIELDSGEMVSYEMLLVAPGIQIDWDKIEGLPQTLGKNGVCSNYDFHQAEYTWEAINSFQGGTAIFTFPSTPIKCAGAPQKIMWLAEETFRQKGIREKSRVIFLSAGGAIFGIPKYREALEKLVKERGIECIFHHDLIKVDGVNKVATARHMETGEEMNINFDIMHVSPPMSAPNFIKESPISTGDALGYVDVDKHTMQHKKYPNIFSLGDASSLPCSKTGAAIRKQAPICGKNMYQFSAGQKPSHLYNGYASCPLVVSRGKCIMAEFGYDGKVMETFPFDQAVPRRSMYILKKDLLPPMYWNAMLKGWA